jgi:hypothetical protein
VRTDVCHELISHNVESFITRSSPNTYSRFNHSWLEEADLIGQQGQAPQNAFVLRHKALTALTAAHATELGGT